MGNVVPGPGSSWTTLEETTGAYDPTEFYANSTDKKGHYQEHRVKAPPQVAGQLSAILATHQFPYRTVNDFYRDAMIHRLHQLALMAKGDNRDRLEGLVAELVVEDRINGARAQLLHLRSLVDSIEALGEQAYQARDASMLEYALTEATALAQTAREPYGAELRQLADLFEQRLARL